MDKKEVEHFLDHVEVFVDKTIPFLVILLLGIIIVEFFYPATAEHYDLLISWADGVIVGVFVIDLFFKYSHVRNIPKFLRYFWLDILAVFPFFLLFQAFEGIASMLQVGEFAERGQKVLHEGLELQKEGAKIVEEVEKTSRIRRATLFGRSQKFFRSISRIPRVLKIVPHQAGKRLHKHHTEKFRARVKKVSK